MDDTRTADELRALIVARQRLLICEANFLRELARIPLVPEEGDAAPADDPAAATEMERPPPARPAKSLALTHNRRSILRATAIERGEEPTHGVIRVLSGVPERSTTRALHWAVDVGLLANRGGVYLPGPASEAREDRAVAQT